MPVPKISALLNNCALHALTPELKEEIFKFQRIPGYDNQHNANYDLLKTQFATFYDLNPNTFTWDKFAHVLKKYNELDTQIIMGPVLRAFMRDKMSRDEWIPTLAAAEEKTDKTYIDDKTELNPNTGRYQSLSPDEVHRHIGRHLGLNVEYVQGNQHHVLSVKNPIATLRMYHQGGIDGAQSGGHWERTQHEKDRIDFERVAGTKLLLFLPLLGHDANMNPYGMSLLKKHVGISAQTLEQQEREKAFLNLALSAEQISFYHEALMIVPKEIAIDLMAQPITTETKIMMDNYVSDSYPRECIYEQWFLSKEANKPHLKPEEEQVIQHLLTPPTRATLFCAKQSKAERIQLLLDAFHEKIERIGTHHKAAQKTAQNLYYDLIILKIEATTFSDKTLDDPINQAQLAQFASKAKTAIETAMPILQKDLGWGDYLVNLAKQMINALIHTISLGYHHGFFTMNDSLATKSAKELKRGLEQSLPHPNP